MFGLVVAGLLIPSDSVAGDLDSVGGFKVKMYKNDSPPEGDGSTGNAVTSESQQAAIRTTPAAVESAVSRATMKPFWSWLLQMMKSR
jgi:hypothetical protein